MPAEPFRRIVPASRDEHIAFQYEPPKDGPRRLLQVGNELTVQDAVIRGEEYKTRLGVQAVGRIGETLISSLGVLADHAFDVRGSLRHPESVLLFDQLVSPGLPHLGQQLYGLANAGAFNIGTAVARSLYPVPQKRGFNLRDFVLGPPADED